MARDYLARAEAQGRRIGLKEARLIEFDERKDDVRRHVPKGGQLIVLDERGDNLSSGEFAGLLGKALDSGVSALTLGIGAADGHDAAIRAAASRILSFGRATWPHMLVRVMAAEQIYRSVTILTDHPYHRA